MFKLTSQQQTKRLRTIFSTLLTIDGTLFMSASIIGWFAYQKSIENGSFPSQEITLTCASIATVGSILLPIVIYQSWSKTLSSENVRRNRGTPLKRLWSLPGWFFSLASSIGIVGIAYHSQHQCNQSNSNDDSICTSIFNATFIRPLIACTLVATVLKFLLMTWSIITPSSLRNLNSLDPHLQADWFYQRKEVKQDFPFSNQSSRSESRFLKKFSLSSPPPQARQNKKYHAKTFSQINYEDQFGGRYELNNISPFDQRSLHRTHSHGSTEQIQSEEILRHQSSFSSAKQQIKRKQIKESDYPITEDERKNNFVIFSSTNNHSVDEVQYFDAISLHSISSSSPSSSTYNLETPKHSPTLQEAVIVRGDLPQKLQAPLSDFKPTTWIIPSPSPSFSPRVFPRKTSLHHNRNIQS